MNEDDDSVDDGVHHNNRYRSFGDETVACPFRFLRVSFSPTDRRQLSFLLV